VALIRTDPQATIEWRRQGESDLRKRLQRGAEKGTSPRRRIPVTSRDTSPRCSQAWPFRQRMDLPKEMTRLVDLFLRRMRFGVNSSL
jgi:hypothetical protein